MAGREKRSQRGQSDSNERADDAGMKEGTPCVLEPSFLLPIKSKVLAESHNKR